MIILNIFISCDETYYLPKIIDVYTTICIAADLHVSAVW